MDDYTSRFAHLHERPSLKVGDTVRFGDFVGIMGTSGQSKHNHLHLDVIIGLIKKIIRLKNIGDNKKYKPSKVQVEYFIDKDLFKIEPYVTTEYLSQKYKEIYGKDHPAIDLVPIDRHTTNEHFRIFWNRTKVGTVLAVGFDKKGYGHYILIGYRG